MRHLHLLPAWAQLLFGCRAGVGAQGFQDTGSCSQRPQRHGGVGGPGVGQGSAGLRGQRGGASALPQGASQEKAVLGRGGCVCLFGGPQAWRRMCAFIPVTPLSPSRLCPLMCAGLAVQGLPSPQHPVWLPPRLALSCSDTSGSGRSPWTPLRCREQTHCHPWVGAWPAHLCANQNGTPGRGSADCRLCVPPMHPHLRPRPLSLPQVTPPQKGRPGHAPSPLQEPGPVGEGAGRPAKV